MMNDEPELSFIHHSSFCIHHCGGLAMPAAVDLRDLPQALSAAAKVPGDLAPLCRKVATYLDSIAAVPFQRQADPSTGRSWAPRKRKVPWRPLQKTGALRQSVRALAVVPA